MFTAEQKTELARALYQVWNGIASDLVDLDPEDQEQVDSMTNEDAVEACLDADRLTTFARAPHLDELIRKSVKEHGYSKVLTECSKLVSLL